MGKKMAFVSGAPEPSRTVAILLGASRWELHEALDNEKMRPAYEAAYRRVRSYLRSELGLGLPDRNLLDLFNSKETSLEQDKHIRDFLRQQVSNEVATCRDILFYFIGHGSTNRDGRFVFILRSTERNRITQTAYSARDFADALKREAPTQRHWLLLDCCASAKAYGDFQPSRSVNDVLHDDVDQFLPALPDTGAALFAACSSDAVALVDVTDSTTLFTAALMNVLERGDPNLGEMLTLSEVAKLTQAEINSKAGPQSVRPEISDPDERKGKISLTPFFPNAGRRIPPIEQQVTALTRAVDAAAGQLSSAESRLSEQQSITTQLLSEQQSITTQLQNIARQVEEQQEINRQLITILSRSSFPYAYLKDIYNMKMKADPDQEFLFQDQRAFKRELGFLIDNGFIENINLELFRDKENILDKLTITDAGREYVALNEGFTSKRLQSGPALDGV
jgi:Caspase domain